jgi:hypothetical protein
VEANAASLIGCYGVTYTKEKIQPWSVFLDSVRPDRDLAGGRRVPGARRARTSRQTRAQGSFWLPIPGGFQLHTGDGLHGFIGDFVARGDSLVGRNFTISDMVLPGPLGYTRVTARRQPCPAVPDSASR